MTATPSGHLIVALTIAPRVSEIGLSIDPQSDTVVVVLDPLNRDTDQLYADEPNGTEFTNEVGAKEWIDDTDDFAKQLRNPKIILASSRPIPVPVRNGVVWSVASAHPDRSGASVIRGSTISAESGSELQYDSPAIQPILIPDDAGKAKPYISALYEISAMTIDERDRMLYVTQAARVNRVCRIALPDWLFVRPEVLADPDNE